MYKTWLVTFVALILTSSALAQAQLTQIVSRENDAFDCRGTVMTVGRDGRVYLSNQQSPRFVLRFGRDGSDKVGGAVVYAMSNATANADGVIATANAHFAGFTVAAQPLVIGTGLDAVSEFRMTVHGDYGLTACVGTMAFSPTAPTVD